MIRLIIFDLDGVLVDAKSIHFDSLNKSLEPQYRITWEEHLSTYDGLKTNQKLNLLTQNKGLPTGDYENIWSKKQIYTLESLKDLTPNQKLISTMSKLRGEGFDLAVCSNSINRTVHTVLEKLGINKFMNLILSNEDVKNSKPHPEMYWNAMSTMECLPEEVLIIEDSPYGLLAASRSKAHIMRVNTPEDVTYENIKYKIESIESGKLNVVPKWKDENLNILIPMAGAGSRFESVGYTFPKPLIDVNGKPMIQVVIDNLNIEANYIYVVQKNHSEKYNLKSLLNLLTPNCKVIEVDGLTEGAACTALMAKNFIDNNNPLLIVNSDQFVEWDSNEFMYKMNETKCDGGILTFKSTHPKWSFVKKDKNGIVLEVAEKNPISDDATVGIYYWKKGSDFVKYSEFMIQKNLRVNKEFYICPVFNLAIEDSKKIRAVSISKMWGLGTPEDLKFFLENKK